MVMTDPIADMLTRIRNANNTLKEEVSIPTSTLKVGIAEILKNEGFIKGYKVEGEGAESNIIITLKYRGKDKVITDLKRISKPGLRVYAKVNEIPRPPASTSSRIRWIRYCYSINFTRFND